MELLFRAWDEERKEMFEVGQISIHKGVAFGDNTIWVNDPHGGMIWCPYTRRSRIIIQSIGLEDKEGTKVFLDDIIETPLGMGVVVWFDDKLGIFSPGSEATDELSAQEIAESVVIGNKHQNPELLK